jgi:triacylglycerol lipase|tara:strand:- start:34587 stop:35342 length:756 start_codon:yes stop_codon:yes gene_type:complete
MSIQKLNFKERSLLFAKLASISYNKPSKVKTEAKKLGFTTVEFYDKDGAQAYRFGNKTDLVVACRGTQPTEFNDISADLKAMPVIAETLSRVHRGFKAEVDMLWPRVMADIMGLKGKRELWFCGHSLGAAMATIMASRCHFNDKVPNPQELYTYGSPRVGWRRYVKSLSVVHHRWKNNNDIVTTVPLRLMGYVHHGTQHYINAYGKYISLTKWQRVKDKLNGMWMGLKKGKVDNFSDHSMTEYIKHIKAID